MDYILTLPLLAFPVLLPLLAGMIAINFDRKFWVWFCLGFILPVIAHIILLCLRNPAGKTKKELIPVEDEHLFDHLFIKKDKRYSLLNGGVIRSKTNRLIISKN
jgi:hypothetical protein